MKKILVPAMLLMGVSLSAQAQFNIYGLVDMSYGKSIGADHFGQRADFHSGGDNGSGEGNSTTRVGLKGSMDLGSGLKGNFKFESNGITSDGDVPAPFFNRKAYAGFSGSFGEVRLGRQDSVPFNVMADYDFNGASNGVSSAGYANAGVWLRGRQSRSLQYFSPAMGGLKFQAGYVPKGNVAGDKNTLSAGVTYAAGPLSVSAAAESKRAVGGTNFASVAGSFDFGAAKVSAGYADGGKDAKGVNLGVSVPVGKFTVGAQLARNSDTKGSAYEVFANTELYKGVYGYLEVGRADAKTGIEGTGGALGVIVTF